MMSSDDFADKLLARSSGAWELVEDWRAVEDVLAGPRAIKGRTQSDTLGGRRQSRYLPRNLSEHPEEYSKRLDMTPCFFETPGVLQARQGALFRESPKITLPGPLAWFEDSATAAGASILDVVVKTAELVQIHGFAGVLLDRAPLPEDLRGREVSVAEVATRHLGRPLWAAYSAPQILDFASNARGLLWVKLLEESSAQSSWDAAPAPVKIVRIADREKIAAYEIRDNSLTLALSTGAHRAEDHEQPGEHSHPFGTPPHAFVVSARPPVAHGCVDAEGLPAVPFVFLHPFPGRDGLGRSILRGVAEADLAATRVLSELMWLLHMMVPLLTFKTNRDEEAVADIGLGASRFLVLQLGSATERSEELSFTQLDPTASDRLAAQYERMVQRAKDQSSRSETVGIAGPVEQSGISRAWAFKTGEERVLHLLAACLERNFQRLLEMTARSAGVPAGTSRAGGTPALPEAVSFHMPDTFDVQGPEFALGTGKELLPLFAQYGLHSAVAATLEKMFLSWIRNPSQELWDKVKSELAALGRR
ncbi:MAG: hypothetical protein ABSE73_08405 [Planctomycetota bacterium]